MHKRAKSASSCVLKINSQISKQSALELKRKFDKSFHQFRQFITYVPYEQKKQRTNVKIQQHSKKISNITCISGKEDLKSLFHNQQLSKSFHTINTQKKRHYSVKRKVSNFQNKTKQTDNYYNPYLLTVKKTRPVFHLKHKSLSKLKQFCQQQKNYNFKNEYVNQQMKNRQPKHKKIKIFESAMRPSLVKKKKQFNHFKMD